MMICNASYSILLIFFAYNNIHEHITAWLRLYITRQQFPRNFLVTFATKTARVEFSHNHLVRLCVKLGVSVHVFFAGEERDLSTLYISGLKYGNIAVLHVWVEGRWRVAIVRFDE